MSEHRPDEGAKRERPDPAKYRSGITLPINPALLDKAFADLLAARDGMHDSVYTDFRKAACGMAAAVVAPVLAEFHECLSATADGSLPVAGGYVVRAESYGPYDPVLKIATPSGGTLILRFERSGKPNPLTDALLQQILGDEERDRTPGSPTVLRIFGFAPGEEVPAEVDDQHRYRHELLKCRFSMADRLDAPLPEHGSTGGYGTPEADERWVDDIDRSEAAWADIVAVIDGAGLREGLSARCAEMAGRVYWEFEGDGSTLMATRLGRLAIFADGGIPGPTFKAMGVQVLGIAPIRALEERSLREMDNVHRLCRSLGHTGVDSAFDDYKDLYAAAVETGVPGQDALIVMCQTSNTLAIIDRGPDGKVAGLALHLYGRDPVYTSNRRSLEFQEILAANREGRDTSATRLARFVIEEGQPRLDGPVTDDLHGIRAMRSFMFNVGALECSMEMEHGEEVVFPTGLPGAPEPLDRDSLQEVGFDDGEEEGPQP